MERRIMGQKPRAAALICELMEMYIAKSKDRKGKQPPAYGMAPDTGQGGHNGHQGKPWKRPQPARK